jgi:anthranilate synthase/aminodeoxychorismate synthase-like glutamine amidotransferase
MRERVLVIDNYDSFTYNLVQYLGEMGAELFVYRNDEIDVEGVASRKPDAIVLSPGPGRPADAGITPAVVRAYSGRIPILGVCLGHQAIGEVFGGRIGPARRLMHGKTSQISHTGHPLFAGIDSPFVATRYHSLVVEPDSIPDALEVIATSDDGEIMGLAHKTAPTFGVQFHPESILTPAGMQILRNFLHLAAGAAKGTAHA